MDSPEGTVVNRTAIAGAVVMMATLALAVLVPSETEAAVMVTLPP
jgi:hypothetical protein